MIIGFTGRKGSGKTAASLALQDNGFRLLSFASTIKKMANVLLRDAGLTDIDIAHAGDHKEDVLPVIGVSYRNLLQTLGTEWGRSLVHENIWCKVARKMLESTLGDVVFDDVRFANEAELIRSMGGVIIHIHRPDLDSDDEHVSENVTLPSDHVIINNASMADLYRQVWFAVNSHV